LRAVKNEVRKNPSKALPAASVEESGETSNSYDSGISTESDQLKPDFDKFINGF
jgi:hypothetical protein